MAHCRLDPNAPSWSAEPMATDPSEYDKAMHNQPKAEPSPKVLRDEEDAS